MSDLVLLTGVSGYLGGHVALQLLQSGYRVRGSVRDLKKADKVRDTLRRAGADTANLEFVALGLLSDTGWAEAMDGVRYLQHVASPFVTAMPKDKMELIAPAVEGTRRALEAAFASKVERVVLTSSMAAVAYGHDKARTTPFTAADWTNVEGGGVSAYVESKTRAEREAWAIAERHGRTSDLAVVNPSAILGPLLDEDPGTSVALAVRLMNGSIPMAPRLSFGMTDVRDTAAVHIAAMVAADAGGRRFPTANGTYSLWEASNILREVVPERASKLPRRRAPDWLVRILALFDKDVRGQLPELGVTKKIDGSDAERLLGRRYIPVRDTLLETAKSLIEQKLI